MSIGIINIIDNNPNRKNTPLLTEHGLSFYFEADGMRFLYDVGASDKFKSYSSASMWHLYRATAYTILCLRLISFSP